MEYNTWLKNKKSKYIVMAMILGLISICFLIYILITNYQQTATPNVNVEPTGALTEEATSTPTGELVPTDMPMVKTVKLRIEQDIMGQEEKEYIDITVEVENTVEVVDDSLVGEGYKLTFSSEYEGFNLYSNDTYSAKFDNGNIDRLDSIYRMKFDDPTDDTYAFEWLYSDGYSEVKDLEDEYLSPYEDVDVSLPVYSYSDIIGGWLGNEEGADFALLSVSCYATAEKYAIECDNIVKSVKLDFIGTSYTRTELGTNSSNMYVMYDDNREFKYEIQIIAPTKIYSYHVSDSANIYILGEDFNFTVRASYLRNPEFGWFHVYEQPKKIYNSKMDIDLWRSSVVYGANLTTGTDICNELVNFDTGPESNMCMRQSAFLEVASENSAGAIVVSCDGDTKWCDQLMTNMDIKIIK